MSSKHSGSEEGHQLSRQDSVIRSGILQANFRPKKKNFKFMLEEKLGQHFYVKFDGKCDGDSSEAQKPFLDPRYGPG